MILLNNATDLLFFYEVTDRHTEPILEVLADPKTLPVPFENIFSNFDLSSVRFSITRYLD